MGSHTVLTGALSLPDIRNVRDEVDSFRQVLRIVGRGPCRVIVPPGRLAESSGEDRCPRSSSPEGERAYAIPSDDISRVISATVPSSSSPSPSFANIVT